MTRSPAPRPQRAGTSGLVAALVVGVLLVLVWMIATGGLGSPTGDEDAPAAVPSSSGADAVGASVPAPPGDAFEVTVEYVVDGDTVRVTAQTATDVIPTRDEVPVRLIGIDTPETYPDEECWGAEATETLRALAPEGATLWAAPDVEWRDAYDRVLLYLWTADGEFVNHTLVARGDAEALLVEPNGAHYPLLLTAEDDARAAALGQWGSC